MAYHAYLIQMLRYLRKANEMVQNGNDFTSQRSVAQMERALLVTATQRSTLIHLISLLYSGDKQLGAWAYEEVLSDAYSFQKESAPNLLGQAGNE